MRMKKRNGRIGIGWQIGFDWKILRSQKKEGIGRVKKKIKKRQSNGKGKAGILKSDRRGKGDEQARTLPVPAD